MRVTALIGIAAIAMSGCLPSTDPIEIDPVSAEETMPLFLFSHSLTTGSYDGHGFLLRRDGRRPLGITAHHVAGAFQPTGPVDPEAPQPSAYLRSIVDVPVVVRLGERLVVPGAQTISAGNSQRDIAAYLVLDFMAERALELAPSAPAVGDTIYVLSLHVGDHPRSGPRRHPVRVTVSSESELRYVYLLSANANMTSGAAVLNKAGRVVGLNVGTVVSNGQVFGIAVGVNSLAASLPD